MGNYGSKFAESHADSEDSDQTELMPRLPVIIFKMFLKIQPEYQPFWIQLGPGVLSGLILVEKGENIIESIFLSMPSCTYLVKVNEN